MSGTLPIECAIFEGGPFPHFQRTLGLFRPVAHNVAVRAILVVFIGWLPLPILVVAQWINGHSTPLSAFLLDFAVHGRSLIAAPLFILCEVVCLSRLEMIVRNFVTAGLVSEQEHARFDQAVASTRALINSTAVEIIAIVAAYSIAAVVIRYSPAFIIPPWYFYEDRDHQSLSLAGWWYGLVSLPLLLILLFSWLVRVTLWARFLFRVSRLNLHLIAAHPDHASGLKFLNTSLLAFMPLAFTFGVITASSAANRVAYQGAVADNIYRTIAGLVVFILILFVGPLLIFAFTLHGQKIGGIFRYGTLAHAVGEQFERKWLANYEKFSSGALESGDFSATTDLYQIVSNVHDMRIFPFDLRTLISLIIVTLLPFIPVALMAVPFRVILKEIVTLLL